MRSFSWDAIWVPQNHPLETIFRAAFVYLFLLLAFRLVGRKELIRYSNTEIILLFLVTVSFRESVVASDISITTAAIGMSTILCIAWFLDWAARQNERLADWLEGPRILLVHRGVIDEPGLRRARLSRDELMSRLRAHGSDDLSEVQASYLERDGKVTFLFHERRRQEAS